MNFDELKVHHLASGASVISISNHPFQFSDGTVSELQSPEWVNAFNLDRKFTQKGEIAGMAINEVQMVFSADQVELLKQVASKADLVILPFPVLAAMRELGIRESFPNCVAFNATKETMREPPQNKIVDINNRSY